MAVTPRIHEVAEQEVCGFEERYPGYRDALVATLDKVVVHQSITYVNQRRDEVAKAVDALGRTAVVAKGGEG
jgi:hypothetical protein